MDTALRLAEVGDHVICERILRALPDWFGIESSLKQYVEDTKRMSTWIARTGGVDAGFLAVNEHNAQAAEIHVIAVRPEHHRGGLGRKMILHIQDDLRARGFEYLQVKTLGPSKPNAEYARTLLFYKAMGFVPLEEFLTLWPGMPCLQLVKKL